MNYRSRHDLTAVVLLWGSLAGYSLLWFGRTGAATCVVVPLVVVAWWGERQAKADGNERSRRP